MQALVYESYTNPSGYKFITLPKPTLQSPSDILIKISAASLNPIDVLKANGLFKMLGEVRKFPVVLGYDYAGTVVEVGTGVNQWKVGDEVYGFLLEEEAGRFSFLYLM